jgi:hypothetical protein
MTRRREKIKGLLVSNGFTNIDENTLNELAEEISESIVGLHDERAIADTIHGNLVASGIDFKDVDNLMEISEDIASSL